MTKNNQSFQTKKKTYFYLVTFLISIFIIFLSWVIPNAKIIGIADILPLFRETAGTRLIGQGLSIFAFAFFLHSFLQSQAFQALFASQRQWLTKRKYFTITLITVAAAILSSNLSWFDEFIHFYPLVVPVLLSVGFDVFSALLCLYGGSVAGLIGLVSSERMSSYFKECFSSVGGVDYERGLAGLGFRLVALLLFTGLVVCFNIWYCSRNKNNSLTEEDNTIEAPTAPPLFTRKRKIVLVIVGFFFGLTILAQLIPVKYTEKISQQVPERIVGNYQVKEYEEQGEIGGKFPIAKVKTYNKSLWEKFGEWGETSIDCWLILGGIIICWLTKQSIIENLTTAAQNSLPLLLIYIFSAVPGTILEKSGLGKLLAGNILSKQPVTGAKYWALIPVFFSAILAGFLVCSSSIAIILVSTLAPILKALSPTILIYAAIFAWMGVMIGMAFSSNQGILQASLEKNQLSYPQFIEKVWPLWLILFIATSGLVVGWTIFFI